MNLIIGRLSTHNGHSSSQYSYTLDTLYISEVNVIMASMGNCSIKRIATLNLFVAITMLLGCIIFAQAHADDGKALAFPKSKKMMSLWLDEYNRRTEYEAFNQANDNILNILSEDGEILFQLAFTAPNNVFALCEAQTNNAATSISIV